MVSEWLTEVKQLLEIHTLHMLPSLAVCVNGLSSAEQFQITFCSNYNLLNMYTFNCSIRDPTALPARLGGFGITKPVERSYCLFYKSNLPGLC